MIIKSIKLTNFRSHSSYRLECKKKTSLIVGENGCGKTSVLEAIYIALQGKSFRAVDREIVQRGTDFYRIELEYCSGEKTVVTFNGEKKQFVASDKKSARLPKKSKYPLILFEPDDLNLIHASPSKKRRYFDGLFSQFSDAYHANLNKYEKALKQRNELLKSENLSPESLFPWNILLAKYGCSLANSRRDFIAEINQPLTETYRSIADNSDQVSLEYISEAAGIDESVYLRELEQGFQRDYYTGHSSFGVHRDDYNFYFNNSLADGSASRGEIRSIIIALKFIEANLVKSQTSLSPVVLLDDVFSELDDTRQACLVQNFKDNQIILTSVNDIG